MGKRCFCAQAQPQVGKSEIYLVISPSLMYRPIYGQIYRFDLASYIYNKLGLYIKKCTVIRPTLLGQTEFNSRLVMPSLPHLNKASSNLFLSIAKINIKLPPQKKSHNDKVSLARILLLQITKIEILSNEFYSF